MTPVINSIPQGGSGFGTSMYLTAYSCGMKAKLDGDYEDKNFYVDPERLDVRVVGQIFHALAEVYHTEKTARIAVQLDDLGVDKELVEAQRIFRDYAKKFPPHIWGEVLGAEVQLEGPEVEQKIGISPWTGRADLVVRVSESDVSHWATLGLALPGPGVYIIDHKTVSRRDKAAWLKYRESLQFKAYPMAWDGLHPDDVCRGMVANVVVRNKTVVYEQYFVPAPNEREQERVQAWFKEAKRRLEEARPNIASCVSFTGCPHLLNGACPRI